LKNLLLQQKIDIFKQKIEPKICSNLPHAFWHRKKHIVQLPYEKYFKEKKYSNKSKTNSYEPRIIRKFKKGN
jgi:hypothetical protein